MMVSSIQALLEQVFIHLHAMTGDQRFFLQHSPWPFFPLFSFSFIPSSPRNKHTQKFTQMLFYRCTRTKPSLLLMFSHLSSVHQQPRLLPLGSLKEHKKHLHPQGYHHFPLPLPEQTASASLVFACHFPFIPYFQREALHALYQSNQRKDIKYMKRKVPTHSWVGMHEHNCNKWHRHTLSSKKM